MFFSMSLAGIPTSKSLLGGPSVRSFINYIADLNTKGFHIPVRRKYQPLLPGAARNRCLGCGKCREDLSASDKSFLKPLRSDAHRTVHQITAHKKKKNANIGTFTLIPHWNRGKGLYWIVVWGPLVYNLIASQ